MNREPQLADAFYTVRSNFRTQTGSSLCPKCNAELRLYLTPKARALRFAECKQCDYVLLIHKPVRHTLAPSTAPPENLP